MSRHSSRGGGHRTPLPPDFLDEKLSSEPLTLDEQKSLLHQNRMLKDNYDLLMESMNKLREKYDEILDSKDSDEFKERRKLKLTKEQIRELEIALNQLKNSSSKKDDFKSSDSSKRKNLRDYFKSDEQPGFFTAFQSRRTSFSDDDFQRDPLLQQMLVMNHQNRVALLSALKGDRPDLTAEYFTSLLKLVKSGDVERLGHNYNNYHKQQAIRTSLLLGDIGVDTRHKDLPLISFSN